ncbi:MAG: CaiB/BaiF CoA-transferase family protein [Gammaproteobacteria bacterium]|nr:CaiB/BaiF CoA-transferase family protein [Gammaproteobacteria bacterium]
MCVGQTVPPLQGITVLAIEQAIAAPLCTRQLADLGARVIKIERPDVGDFARHYDTRVKGQSSHFVWTNRGKESLTMDLKSGSGRHLLDRLLEQADVLVQNLTPAAAKRMGLGYEELSNHYPQLILCNISGYGSSGSYANRKAYDLLVQAEAGLLTVTGLPDTLVKSGISIADIAAGTQAHAGILAALIQRGKTGRGACLDISMLEAMVEWMGFPLYYAYEGAEPPLRTGADHASIYPYGLFTSQQDDVIMLGVQNQREWQHFCEQVIEQPQLFSDSRFVTNAQRSANRQILKNLIQDAFSRSSTDVIISKLDTAKIAYAQVNHLNQVWNHPQLRELKRFVEVASPGGAIETLLPPVHNSEFGPVTGEVPKLGQHTESILAELGLSEEEIQNLQEQSVI